MLQPSNRFGEIRLSSFCIIVLTHRQKACENMTSEGGRNDIKHVFRGRVMRFVCWQCSHGSTQTLGDPDGFRSFVLLLQACLRFLLSHWPITIKKGAGQPNHHCQQRQCRIWSFTSRPVLDRRFSKSRPVNRNSIH